LTKLHERHVFGWPADAPLPAVPPLECAQRFQMDGAKWQAVCGYSAWFYNRMAFARHDPAERLAKAAKYGKAAQDLEAGTPTDSVRIPGVGPRAEPVLEGRKNRSSGERRIEPDLHH
jgi:hypothetical protein